VPGTLARGGSQGRAAAGTTNGGSSNSNGNSSQRRPQKWAPPAAAAAGPRKKGVPERLLRTIRRKAINLWLAACRAAAGVLGLHPAAGATTVCVGRNERLLLTGSSGAEAGGFLNQLAAHLGTFVAIAAAVAVADVLLVAPFVAHLSTACKAWVVGVAMYCRLLLLDYDRMEGEATAGQPSYLKVQDALRVFLELSTYEYAEDAVPFPADDGSDLSEDDVWRDVGGASEEQGFAACDLGGEVSVAHGAGNGNDSPTVRRATAATATATAAAAPPPVVAALGGSKGIFGMVSALQKAPVPLHPTLAPGSCFDNCEFIDVSKEARAMYTCRATTHPLKVRRALPNPHPSPT